MNDLLKPITDAREISKKTGVPLDKLADVLAELHNRDAAQTAERRATADEKEAIAKVVASLNGELADIAVSDVLQRAGVRKAQGTASFAKREVKRVLEITHQK